MAEPAVYAQIGVDKSTLESELSNPAAISYDEKQSFQIKIVAEREFQRYYRMKNYAAQIHTEMYSTQDRISMDRRLWIKRRKPEYQDTFKKNLDLSIALYDIFLKDQENVKNHIHTAERVPQSRRKIPLFAKPLGTQHNFFSDNKISVCYFEGQDAFDQMFSENEKYNCEDLIPALDLYALLFDRMPPLIKREMQKLKNIKEGKNLDSGDPLMKKAYPVLEDLAVLGLEDYASNFNKIIGLISPSILPEENKEKIKRNFEELVTEYLLPKDHETIIQADSFPWHNNTSTILDTSKICYGSRGLSLGCLFGHPDIFLNLSDPKIEMERLIGGIYPSRKKSIELQFGMPNAPLDMTTIIGSFYVGALCGHSELLTDYAPFLKTGESKKLVDAMYLSLSILSQDDAVAEDIFRLISDPRIPEDIERLCEENTGGGK